MCRITNPIASALMASTVAISCRWNELAWLETEAMWKLLSFTSFKAKSTMSGKVTKVIVTKK